MPDIDMADAVQKVLEGLRGEAFLIARDIGLERLCRNDGLEHLIVMVKQHVFPLAHRRPVSCSVKDSYVLDHYPDNRERECFPMLTAESGGGPLSRSSILKFGSPKL